MAKGRILYNINNKTVTINLEDNEIYFDLGEYEYIIVDSVLKKGEVYNFWLVYPILKNEDDIKYWMHFYGTVSITKKQVIINSLIKSDTYYYRTLVEDPPFASYYDINYNSIYCFDHRGNTMNEYVINRHKYDPSKFLHEVLKCKDYANELEKKILDCFTKYSITDV